MPPTIHTVHVVAKSGGFRSAVMWVIGLLLFAGVFILGISIGVGAMLAGSNFDNVVLRENYRGGFLAKTNIAVIPIEGVIDGFMAEFVRTAVDDVLEDQSIAAVVLRVDSPGGGVSPSDEIWYQIERLKNAQLPVIASYGGIAASGGYYVSCATDHIVAEPTCITGSIGVIAQVLTMEELMNKIGVEPVTLVASGSPAKDVANNPFRQWNEADKAKLGKMLDSAYITFRERVKTGRAEKISDSEALDRVADGSIYTAYEALSNGLVDGVGYLDDAIAHAEKAAGLQPGSSSVFVLRQPPSLFGNGLFGQLNAPRSDHAFNADRVRSLLDELSAPRVAYLMH